MEKIKTLISLITQHAEIIMMSSTCELFFVSFRMKFAVAVLIAAACCIQLTAGVPVKPRLDSESEEDLCDLEGLADILPCQLNDDDCETSNNEKLERRKVVCETHPNCSYCEWLEDVVTDEPLIVDPEVVEPIYEPVESPVDGETPETLPDELRAPPIKLIERNIIIENDNETQYYRGYVESAANITTVIRLTNLINNTNIVNMPTTLNNTNINNIHVYQNKTSDDGGKFGLGFTDRGPCCFAVEAKDCKRSTSGTKCHHKKTRVCGRQCTDKVIHPKKNPCAAWPYSQCPPYQYPGFYPPPNYYPPPQFAPGYPGFYPPNSQQPEDFDDDYDLPLFPDEDMLEHKETDWVVGPEKCKIVSEDGLQIVNCTLSGFEFEHPYAKNTVEELGKRSPRQATHPSAQMPNQDQQMYPPQMAYYPVMYQPVYMQPVPMYLPQYYPQPPPNYYPPQNYYQPPQLALPPIDRNQYYEDHQQSNEINSYQKPKKRGKKHHPVVMEVDDEL